MNRLEDFLKPTQKELFSRLCRTFKGSTVVSKGEFILVKGEAPVMLLAHLDTVHKEPVNQICKTQNGNILMSPQGIGGDDRCGVYALVTAYRIAEQKPWLLFTCDEEIGGRGAEAFVLAHQTGQLPKELDDLKMLVEIDRKGRTDAVYYDCENEEFEEYITSKGFETEWGSFSDISVVAPELGVAAVNLSSGYYNAHTLHEYINRKHLNATVKKVVEMIADSCKPDFPKYEYIERVWGGVRGGSGWLYDDMYDLGYWRDRGAVQRRDVPLADKDHPPAEGEVPGNLPSELVDDYFDLLDYYSSHELEQLRAEYGDGIIQLMHEEEFGPDYRSDYDAPEDEDDEEDQMAVREIVGAKVS